MFSSRVLSDVYQSVKIQRDDMIASLTEQKNIHNTQQSASKPRWKAHGQLPISNI